MVLTCDCLHERSRPLTFGAALSTPLLLLLQIASDGLKGRVFEVSLADLQKVCPLESTAEQLQQSLQQLLSQSTWSSSAVSSC